MCCSPNNGRILVGFLIDRVPSRICMMLGLLLQVVAFLLIPAIRSFSPVLYLVAFAQALSGSFMMTVTGVVYANYFGRKHLASIQSIGTALVVLGSALGPFPFGYCKDTFGSFIPAFLVSTIFPIFCCMAVYFRGHNPHRLAREQSEEEGLSMVQSKYSEVKEEEEDRI